MRFRMQKFKFESDNNTIRMTFLKNEESYNEIATLVFRHVWDQPPADLLGWGIDEAEEESASLAKELFRGLSIHGSVEGSKEEVETVISNMRQTYLLSVPHEVMRMLLFDTMAIWSKFARCPMELSLVEHPGYPLLSIQYSGRFLNIAQVASIVREFLRGIATMQVERMPHDGESHDSAEEEDPFSTAEIIEYEVDPEVRELSKTPQAFMTLEAFRDAAGEIVASEEEGVDFPPVPYPVMYATRKVWMPLSLLSAQDKTISNFVPLNMIREHGGILSSWCYPTPEAAYKTLCAPHVRHYSDKELRENFPQMDSFVYRVNTVGTLYLAENDFEGLLIIKENEMK